MNWHNSDETMKDFDRWSHICGVLRSYLNPNADRNATLAELRGERSQPDFVAKKFLSAVQAPERLAVARRDLLETIAQTESDIGETEQGITRLDEAWRAETAGSLRRPELERRSRDAGARLKRSHETLHALNIRRLPDDEHEVLIEDARRGLAVYSELFFTAWGESVLEDLRVVAERARREASGALYALAQYTEQIQRAEQACGQSLRMPRVGYSNREALSGVSFLSVTVDEPATVTPSR